MRRVLGTARQREQRVLKRTPIPRKGRRRANETDPLAAPPASAPLQRCACGGGCPRCAGGAAGNVLSSEDEKRRRRLQRACGPGAIGAAPTPGCNLQTVPLPQERFFFKVNCDEFAPGEELRLRQFAAGATGNVTVVGMASSDGAQSFNEALSCRRAEAGRAVLAGEGVTVAPADVLATGPVPNTTNDRSVRAVGINLDVPSKPKNCGPDVTDWFVAQVARAMVDPAVLAVRRDMAAADALARRHGTTAQELSDGGAAAAVLAQEARMGANAPARDPTITGQLAAAVPGQTAGQALLRIAPVDALRITRLLTQAATGWRDLVNHGARYDFKTNVMNCPTEGGCPEQPTCKCTVTYCSAEKLNMCFVFDTPGNLFYALIGKFVGFSELTLQLGSQLAQLTGTATWDPPEDTRAIRIGFALPLALNASNLCASLVPERLNLNFSFGCENCTTKTTAGFM